MKSKPLISLFLAISMLVGMFAIPLKAASLVSINDNSVFLKQNSSNTCTLASALMMFRRGALINEDSNWNTFTEANYKSKWWGSGLAFKINGNGMYADCYKLEDDYDLPFGNVGKKKAWFIEQLKKHSEGIVIYFYVKNDSSVTPHAILLTDYDDVTNTFYCADPANSAKSGRIPLVDSSILKYAKAVANKRGVSQGQTSNQDFIISCVVSVWMIYQGIDYSTTTTQTQYRYYHYTDGKGHYSVCAYYGKNKYGGTWYREDTDWLDAPLTKVSSNYIHTTSSACKNAGCTDPSWEGGKYEDSNGIVWYREETQKVTATAECSHTYGTAKITKNATCTSAGTKQSTCTKCGDTKTTTISKLGHSYNAGETTQAATCGKTGVKTYTCTSCGETKTETIAKTNAHSYNSGAITKAATCTQNGTQTFTCTVCSTTKNETITKLGHSYDSGKITKEATCGSSGTKTYTCSACGDTKTETISADSAHSFDNGVVTKEPTCTENGSETYTCTVCGKTKTQNINKSGHNYKVIQAEIESTCTAKGKTAIEECINCGSTKGGKSISKIGHDYSDEWTIDKQPTCTEKGSKSRYCTVCGEKGSTTSISKTEHTYGNWEITKAPQPGKKGSKERTCISCGYIDTENVAAITKKSNDRRIIMTIGCTEATVFGKETKNDVPPVIVKSRTMLPARFVAENLGATVEWDAAARKVTITGNDVKIELYIDKPTAYVNGEAVTLDSAPFINGNRTYLPVRFIAESLGATVEWNGDNQQAIITKK